MLELARTECLQLLAATGIGRVVVSVTEWDHPVIRPVNYLFDESSQSVLIRTAPGSKLHALLRAVRPYLRSVAPIPRGESGGA